MPPLGVHRGGPLPRSSTIFSFVFNDVTPVTPDGSFGVTVFSFIINDVTPVTLVTPRKNQVEKLRRKLPCYTNI